MIVIPSLAGVPRRQEMCDAIRLHVQPRPLYLRPLETWSDGCKAAHVRPWHGKESCRDSRYRSHHPACRRKGGCGQARNCAALAIVLRPSRSPISPRTRIGAG